MKDSKTRRLLILEGKLVAPWTDELRSVCPEPGSNADSRGLVIDLQGVTVISAEGEDTLIYLLGHGANFRGAGLYIKQVLKQLAPRLRRNEGDKNRNAKSFANQDYPTEHCREGMHADE